MKKTILVLAMVCGMSFQMAYAQDDICSRDPSSCKSDTTQDEGGGGSQPNKDGQDTTKEETKNQ